MPNVDRRVDATSSRDDAREEFPSEVATDEITSIARKVLEDLESFVDETGNAWHEFGQDDDANENKPIGVSLEELRLILATSIRRHDDRQSRAGGAARGIDRSSATRRMEYAPVAPAPHASQRYPKSKKKARSRRLRDPQLTGSLHELNELLESKREEFARLRDENRRQLTFSSPVAPRRLMVDRQTPDGTARSHSTSVAHKYHHSHSRELRHKDATAESGLESPISSSVSATSSLANRSSCSSHSSGRRHDGPSQVQRTERTLSTKADKACFTMPSDFGPDVNDLPRQMLTQSHGATQTTQIENQHSVRLGELSVSPLGEFSRPLTPGSSCSSSHSSSIESSKASSSTRRSRASRSANSSSSSHSSACPRRSRRNDAHSQSIRRSTPDRNAARSIPVSSIPAPVPPPHEQLEWELDLSNFNI